MRPRSCNYYNSIKSIEGKKEGQPPGGNNSFMGKLVNLEAIIEAYFIWELNNLCRL
jgi:hypothetical protein